MSGKYVHSLFQQIHLHDWIISVKAIVLLQVKQLPYRQIDFFFFFEGLELLLFSEMLLTGRFILKKNSRLCNKNGQ